MSTEVFDLLVKYYFQCPEKLLYNVNELLILTKNISKSLEVFSEIKYKEGCLLEQRTFKLQNSLKCTYIPRNPYNPDIVNDYLHYCNEFFVIIYDMSTLLAKEYITTLVVRYEIQNLVTSIIADIYTAKR